MRVSELAKALELSSKELLVKLKTLRIAAKSASSILDADAVNRARKALAKPKKPAPTAKPAVRTALAATLKKPAALATAPSPNAAPPPRPPPQPRRKGPPRGARAAEAPSPAAPRRGSGPSGRGWRGQYSGGGSAAPRRQAPAEAPGAAGKTETRPGRADRRSSPARGRSGSRPSSGRRARRPVASARADVPPQRQGSGGEDGREGKRRHQAPPAAKNIRLHCPAAG